MYSFIAVFGMLTKFFSLPFYVFGTDCNVFHVQVVKFFVIKIIVEMICFLIRDFLFLRFYAWTILRLFLDPSRSFVFVPW